MNLYNIFRTDSYLDWFNREAQSSQYQIETRIGNIVREGYFGDRKKIDKVIWELRWKNGRRIYYACVPEKNILLILGGNKNGQTKDINRARKTFRKYVVKV